MFQVDSGPRSFGSSATVVSELQYVDDDKALNVDLFAVYSGEPQVGL